MSTDLRAELDALAEKICEAAKKDDTQLDQRIDALKTLTAYYATREKINAKFGAPGDEDNFETFANTIRSANRGDASGSATEPPANRRRDS